MDATNQRLPLDNVVAKGSNPDLLLPDELSSLVQAFVSSEDTYRSKAYLALTAICQSVRTSTPSAKAEVASEKLATIFTPHLYSRIRDTDEININVGVTFLTALFQVDWQSASTILQQDGVLDNILDATELYSDVSLRQNIAHLLGQACGYKPSCSILPPQLISWLETQSRQTNDVALRAAAGVALIKLSKAMVNEEGPQKLPRNVDEELTLSMKQMVLDDNDSSLLDAVEGLAYLSTEPEMKEVLSKDTAFLRKLFSLAPSRKSTASSSSTRTLTYGILVIVANLCSHRPQLSEEQSQIEKLKHMTRPEARKPGGVKPESIFDDNEHVKQRARRIVDAGALAVFPTVTRETDSLGMKTIAGKALLGIVEDKDNRGKVLQSGGARVLMSIVKALLLTRSKGPSLSCEPNYLEVTDLEPIQALAKLAITSSPVQVFGPDIGVIYDAIRPLSFMLQHSSSRLLQRFEAMMALTNLASHSAEVASRIAKADGLLSKVEFLLLEDHTLVRRAAVELVCNLITGSDDVFERYGGGDDYNEAIKSRVQILAALSDVEDLSTRLAASGALATVASAPSACKALINLQTERGRILPVITQLIDPSAVTNVEQAEDTDGVTADAGLTHRGVICARSLFFGVSDPKARKKLSEDAKTVGLMQALINTIKDPKMKTNETVLRPAMETIQVIMNDTTS